MAIRKRKDGRWVVYYRSGDGSGKIVEEYFGRGAEGETAAKERQRELGLRKYTGGKKQARTPGILFYELSKAYTQNKQFNANSKRHLKLRLSSNILPFFGQMPGESIKHSDMDKYVRKRVKDGVKYSTIAREITDIKAILNWSARRQPALITVNPVRDYPKPQPDDVIIMPPTREEIKAILNHAPQHLRRAIHLAYYVGMRPGAVELLSLTWGNINWEDQMIHVLSARKGGPIRRAVDIHPAFYDVLVNWYAQDQEYFKKTDINDNPIVHFYGRAIKRIHKTWKNTLERAKITRRIRPYDMRHQFVTRALEGGADLKTVSEIVGSSPRTLMQTYQHVSNPLRKRTINNMDDLGGKDDEFDKNDN
ncbi:MAG: site-specific integrase [Desulfobacteraceae bacterium]|nr:site-specific integrase [Desulfobacteraceae bacterium]